MVRTTKVIVAALGLLAAASCNDDRLFRPANSTPISPLFERYVSMGNSITAGFQSAGINDSTQLQSYAVLLAAQMGTPFFPPLLNRPGCPPPFTNAFLQQRVGGGTGTTCFLRKIPTIPPPYVTNVAVPGAYVFDPLSNFAGTSHPNQLTTLFLGGLSQIEAAHRVDPTFVSFWLGNNDVLGAATDLANAGNPAEVTDTSVFKATLHAALDSLANPKEAPSLKGAILIGAANVTEIPFFNTGSTYFGIKNTTTNFPATFIVLPNCAPASLAGQGDSTLIPWPLGAALIGAAAAGATDTLDCSSDRYVQPAELDNLLATVNSYNAAISAEASARGWAYLDPNPTLDSLHAIPTQVAPFFGIGKTCAQVPFGLAFSCDAVHPSAATHKLIANKLIQAINAKYGTSLAAIP